VSIVENVIIQGLPQSCWVSTFEHTQWTGYLKQKFICETQGAWTS
jgi:hypothetical protein